MNTNSISRKVSVSSRLWQLLLLLGGDNKKQLGTGRIIHFILPHQCLSSKKVRAGTEGKNAEAGTKAEVIDELLIGLQLMVHLGLAYPGAPTTHHELGLLTSITGQENNPQACPQANWGGGEHFFQLRFLFPASVELTKKSSTETNRDLNSGQMSLGLHIKPLRKRPAAAKANPIKFCIIITSSQMLSWGLLTEDKHVDVLNGEAKD